MNLDPLFPFWIIVLITLAATFFLLWLEWKREPRLRTMRMVAVIVMMLALLGIALKPQYRTNRSTDIILLTQGYSTKKVDSLMRKNQRLIVMHLDNTAAYKNSKPLMDFEANDLDQNIRYVVGQGIPLNVLDLMDTKAFILIPTIFPQGVTTLSVPPALAHRKNTVSGTFLNNNRNVWLYLRGPGGNEDSVLISGSDAQYFKLSFTTKHPGQFIFDLIVKDSIETMEEQIPISVRDEQPLKVLFLHHYPTFETQFLKTFLQKKNHPLIVRYQISKSNFRFEFINRNPQPFNRITSELLEETDLIISDAESVSKLPLAEQRLLEKALGTGLGMIYLAGNGKTNESRLYPFKINAAKNDTAHVRLGGKLHVFPIGFHVKENAALIALNKNKNGVIAGYNFDGAGKIGFQNLQETFRLTLSGDSAAYSTLWTPLLEMVARPSLKTSKIRITTPFPLYKDEPIDIEVISSTENIALLDDSIVLPLKEHSQIDNVWHARTWGGTPGWHTLEAKDERLHYYVLDSGAWNSLALMNQRRANELVKESLPFRATTPDVWEEVPPWIFYLVFLLSAGFIWVVPKI